MRKIFTSVIFIFIVIGSILIMIIEDRVDTIELYTIKKSYSRLITDNYEKISFPLYISSKDSFLTDKDNIESCYIYDDNNEISVSLYQIRFVDEYRKINQSNYNLFMLDIGFNDITVDEITFSDASLRLNYQNQEIIELKVGNLNLRFSDIDQNLNIDLYRAYTTVKSYENVEYISGIVLGLNALNDEDIIITNISIGSDRISPDLKNIKALTTQVDIKDDVSDILGYEYNQFSDLLSAEYTLTDNLMYIPFLYTEKVFLLNRFPIYIEYKINDNYYEYIIDDFMYVSENYNFEVDNDNLQQYIYNYQ